MTRTRSAGIAIHLLLTACAIPCAYPFTWLLGSAFRDNDGHLTLQPFRTLLQQERFGSWMLNSIFLASSQTVLIVLLSSLGGFALAKYAFRGRRMIHAMMLATVLVPSQVLLPGAYELMQRIGWIDTRAAIIIPGAVSVFGLFLFQQAMRTVPDELLHAGRIDGCSELRLWWEIALPIVRPVIGAFTLMTFLSCWNSFLWPQIILQSESKYTLPMGLANLMSLPGQQSDYHVLMAGTLLGMMPVFLLFVALQKDFVAGLASGAVKG